MGSKQVAIHDGGKYGRVLVDLTKAGSFDVASGAFVGGAGEGEWTWFDRVVVAHGGVFFFFFFDLFFQGWACADDDGFITSLRSCLWRSGLGRLCSFRGLGR